jgi:GTP-binding protein
VGLVIILNKWDALDDEQKELTERSLPDRFGFVGWAPVLRMSAQTGARIQRLPGAIEAVLEGRGTRLPTGQLNRAVRKWAAGHPPPVRKGRRPKIHYVVQAGTAPPTFVVFISGGTLGDDYLRFLENRLRDEADFTGTPLHIVSRAGDRR